MQSQQTAESDEDDFGAPAAAVYKTHSTSIFDVLEDLKEKAEGRPLFELGSIGPSRVDRHMFNPRRNK